MLKIFKFRILKLIHIRRMMWSNAAIREQTDYRPMDSAKYRIFVCTKKRAIDDPEGCCCNLGALTIYQQFQSEVARLELQERVEIRQSGCLDRCESGAIAMVYQPSRGEFAWLPTKLRVKLRQLLYPRRILYGRLQPQDVEAIAEHHLLKGQVYEPCQLTEK